MVSAETLLGAASGPEVAFKPTSTIGTAFRSRAFVIAERRLRVRLEEGFDTVLLMGEAGAGKTTLLSALAAELAWAHPLIHLAQPPFGGSEALDRWREITAAVESGRVVAVIDDADSLPIELHLAAHEARRSEAGPRVQFILGVKPSAYGRYAGVAAHLDEAMACCTLERLEDDEIAEYVGRHLEGVGADPRHFTREALTHVAICAQGLPRLVNLICAKACFVAGLNNELRVSAASVEEAAFTLRLSDISIGRPLGAVGAAQSAA